VEEKEMTPEEFAALARSAGLVIPPASLEEMAKAYDRLQELAQRVRAAQAEPAHVFVPPRTK
jgi:hypothetical protein